ncbi:hypothetical protein [Psychrobacter ciconiae]|uniref:hypothetical protein n=1 Tax=Psychrobacter ciconiae TaxID=1553449 RepID=UPI001918CA71|nr:hypothetical protein [Psychrobacter ciconiae]
MDFYNFKEGIVVASGLDKDALHIYVGVSIYLLSLIVLRPFIKKLGARGMMALIIVTIIALLGEYLDNKPTLIKAGLNGLSDKEIRASIHDLINTCLLPYVLYFLTGFTKLFNKTTEPKKLLNR